MQTNNQVVIANSSTEIFNIPQLLQLLQNGIIKEKDFRVFIKNLPREEFTREFKLDGRNLIGVEVLLLFAIENRHLLSPILIKINDICEVKSEHALTIDVLKEDPVLQSVWSLLKELCVVGNLVVVQLMLYECPFLRKSINLVDQFSTPLLHGAVTIVDMQSLESDESREQLIESKISIIQLLLYYGASLDISGIDNVNALTIAVGWGSVNIIKFLVEKGASVNVELNTLSPLHIATSNNNVEVVKFLVSNKANVNHKNSDGHVPLTYACKKGFFDIAQYLVTNGADINVLDNENRSLFQVACQGGNLNIVKYLLNLGLNPKIFDAKCKSSMQYLIYSNAHESETTKIFNLLIENGVDFKTADSLGCTPLYSASRKNKLALAIKLIALGAHVNQPNHKGYTPLYIACKENNVNLVELLLDNGADIHEPGDEDDAPFLIACQAGHIEIVKLFLKRNTDVKQLVNFSNRDGYTPLNLAVRGGHSEVVKLLIGAGANILQRGKDDKTALHIALKKKENNLMIMHLIVSCKKAKQDLNVVDYKGDNLLHVAAENNQEKFIITLIAPETINAKNNSGDTPLSLACKSNALEAIEILIDKGADINAKNNQGDTPLCLACKSGSLEAIKILIEKGADIYLALEKRIKDNYSDKVAQILLAAKAQKDADKKKQQNKKKNKNRKTRKEGENLLQKDEDKSDGKSLIDEEGDSERQLTTVKSTTPALDVPKITVANTSSSIHAVEQKEEKENEREEKEKKLEIETEQKEKLETEREQKEKQEKAEEKLESKKNVTSSDSFASTRYSVWSDSAIARKKKLQEKRNSKLPKKQTNTNVNTTIENISDLDLVWGGVQGLRSTMEEIKTIYNTPTGNPNMGFYCPPNLLKEYPGFSELINAVNDVDGVKFARAFADQGIKPLKGADKFATIKIQIGNAEYTCSITHEYKPKNKELQNDRLYLVSIPSDNKGGQLYIAIRAGKALHVNGAKVALKDFATAAHKKVINISLPREVLGDETESVADSDLGKSTLRVTNKN